MSDEEKMVGRVLKANTTRFTVGCHQVIAERATGQAQGLGQTQDLPLQTPPLGAFLKAVGVGGSVTYGVVTNVAIEDDPFVRQLVAAGVDDEEYIADQRQRRQVPVVIEVLAVGGGRGLEVHHRLPAIPPGALDRIYACNAAEVVRFTAHHDWLRTIAADTQIPTDAVMVAALREAATARPPGPPRREYLVEAGRTLARLLAMDLVRLDGILHQLPTQLINS